MYILYIMEKIMRTSLRENAKNIIEFEKKKMIPLTKKQLKSHEDARVCYIFLFSKRFFQSKLSKSYRSLSLHR